jgi:hypothetical protein
MKKLTYSQSEETKNNLEKPVKTELAIYFAQLLTRKKCPLISAHTSGGLSFKTWEEGEITWCME